MIQTFCSDKMHFLYCLSQSPVDACQAFWKQNATTYIIFKQRIISDCHKVLLLHSRKLSGVSIHVLLLLLNMRHRMHLETCAKHAEAIIT